MAGPIPTRKISQLTAYGVPLAGTELLEIWVTNTSRRVTARDFVLPAVDPVVMAVDMSSTHPASRHIESSATIQYNDGGPGGAITFDALFTGALPGNPTALIGLTPINGVAVTWMRSDAAPALNQGIAPTWTALHTFAAGLLAAANDPFIRLSESDAAANNRVWDFTVVGEQFRGRVGDDALAAFTTWITVDRTLNTVDLINLLATTVSVNGQNVRDTAILTSGTMATARLGSGVADATTWLRGDSTWQTLPGGFTGFANPTASVGLAAVNGVATTAMRSDAAPALDQAIAPTWTAQHIFGLSGATNAAVLVSSAQPQVDWNESDAAANNRRWRWEAQGEQFLGRTVNDANSAAVTWIAVDRTLNVVDTIALTSTALTWNGNPLLSTATAFANPTASIGLAAVNGAATTAMRSDAAPALSQAIAPSWTAQHSWTTAGTNATPNITLTNARPGLQWFENDATANNGKWQFIASAEAFFGQILSDDAATATTWVQVDRTGTTVDSVTFPSQGTFTSVATGPSFPIVISSTFPGILLDETDGSANNKQWRLYAAGEQFVGQVATDAGAGGGIWIQVDRTGTTIDRVAFPTATTGSLLVGLTSALAPSTVAQFFSSGINGVADITSASGNFCSVEWNQSTTGDSGFILFQTEASPTTRGSIVYNRAGGLVAYNTTSDARRKKNIQDSGEASPIIDAIRVRSFEWLDSDMHLDYWLVAQELHAVFPVAVTVGDDSRDWAIDPSKLIPVMVKEIQSLRGRVRELEIPGRSRLS